MRARQGSAQASTRFLVFWLGLASALAGTASPSGATDREWSFEVLEVLRIDRETHLIRLRPTPRGSEFPRSCENLVIHSFYDLASWSSESRAQLSRSDHERSLRMLAQAQALNKIVRIGSYGRGFGTLSESSMCEVTSRALSVVLDPGGAPVIFSVYEDPETAP